MTGPQTIDCDERCEIPAGVTIREVPHHHHPRRRTVTWTNTLHTGGEKK